MLKNYLTTAFRNLMRDKTGTFLNLGGLTLGITCSIILILIIDFHSGFDRYHSKGDRIYRVVYKGITNGQVQFQSGVPAPLPDAFTLDFPEAEESVFASYRANALVRIPQKGDADKKFQEERGVVFTESSFFRVFDRKVVAGDRDGALDEPGEAVISKKFATKYFGKQDVVGELVIFDNRDYRISAVMEDAPSNTDFPFELMLSYETIKNESEQKGWYSIWSDEHFYFLLKEGDPLDRITERLPAFSRKYRDRSQDQGEFMVLPLSEMHFDSRFETFTYQTIPETVLFILGTIAGILILTACINFVNLATADAVKRSREVGIRKTMGSTRTQLVLQFLGETTLITAIAVMVSLALSQIALGFVNPFLGVDLSIDFTGSWLLPTFLIGITIVVSFFSGFYPSLVISSFRPADALKNKMENRASGGYFLRSALVVFQFFISQFFIIGTIVLIRQTDLFMHKDMGFSREAIVLVPVPAGGEQDSKKVAMRRKTLRDEVARISGVEMISLASAAPFSGEMNKTIFKIQDDPTEYTTQYKSIDHRYLDLFNIELMSGKNLSGADTIDGFLVNENFARMAGLVDPADVVGKMITVQRREFPVVGVVRDFNTASLQNPIEPTVLFSNINSFKTMVIRVSPGHVTAVLESVKKKWDDAYPDQIFEYSFMDESIRSFYESQRKMTQLLVAFTSIAIFIGCLGLFGLVSFMTNQKTKEIGIRKVLGASVEHILVRFSWSYIRLIVIGFLLAVPLGYLAMQQFLNEFAYKVPLTPWIFITAFGWTIAIALLTAGYRSFRTATADPVKSLRYE